MKLQTRIVEKPWGRTDIPAAFGDHQGRRIGEIWFEEQSLAGDADHAAPIMVKFLFTSERLSIQVHPDDTAARACGLPSGKEECWLVLDAEPGAELGVGLTRSCTIDALRSAAMDGSLVDLVDWRSASAGDFVYNPAGTIHAIGAGLMLVEVQQNVDCTYRLHDYGRPRALHLEEGLAVARTAPHHDPRDRRLPSSGTVTLVAGPHFHLVRAHGPVDPALLPPRGTALTIVPLAGGCTVAGEPLHFGECARTDDPASLTLAPGALALLCWPS